MAIQNTSEHDHETLCATPEAEMMRAFTALETRLDAGERISAYDLRDFLNLIADVNDAGGAPVPGAGERFLREALHFRRVSAIDAAGGAKSVSLLTWENTDTAEATPSGHDWVKAIF